MQSGRKVEQMRLIEEANPDFESCDDCIHSDDSEKICIFRGCIHAVTQLSECYKPKQPEQRTGKWIRNPDDTAGSGYFICSECKTDFYDVWKYCPNCGAKMEGTP